MASRVDFARLARRQRISSAGIRVAGQRRLSRQDATILGLLTDTPEIPAPTPATESDAMSLPPFGRAVAILANAIASTEWDARKPDQESGVLVRLPDQPSILTDPDPLHTAWHYKWAVAEDAILYGNHFALMGEIDWRTGRAGWLVPIPADQMWIMTDPANPGWYEWVIGGVTFSPDEIFHVPFGGRSGEILGRGVLEQYGYWLSGATAAEEYSRDVFAAGALPPAVILTNQATTQGQADELKAKWRQVVATREPVLLPNGTEVRPIVGNAMQAQLIEARKWNAQLIADVVGIPGWKLGLDGPSMTYQNIETADIDFVRDCVDRYGRPLSDSISKWLLPGDTRVVWDYASRMRADTQTTMNVLVTGYQSGILTQAEARAALNRLPLPTQQNGPDAAQSGNGAGQDGRQMSVPGSNSSQPTPLPTDGSLQP